MQALPSGVRRLRLSVTRDGRGSLTEIFRSGWLDDAEIAQWNLERSRAGVLRGVQVHQVRTDCFVMLEGLATVGLCDLRPASPTFGQGTALRVTPLDDALKIPPGIAHGFYFHEPTLHLNGLSEPWDPADDRRIHWSDPGLAIPWPTSRPTLSSADAAAGGLHTFGRAST